MIRLSTYNYILKLLKLSKESGPEPCTKLCPNSKISHFTIYATCKQALNSKVRYSTAKKVHVQIIRLSTYKYISKLLKLSQESGPSRVQVCPQISKLASFFRICAQIQPQIRPQIRALHIQALNANIKYSKETKQGCSEIQRAYL